MWVGFILRTDIPDHLPFPGDTSERYFVVEKPGLDVASLGGVAEDVPDE